LVSTWMRTGSCLELETCQYGFPSHTVENETTHKRRQSSAEIKEEYIKAHR
jgi:hypothetical protein